MNRKRTHKDHSFLQNIFFVSFLTVPFLGIYPSLGWAKTVSISASSEAWHICYEDYFPDKNSAPPDLPSQPGLDPCADALSKCQDDVTEDIIHIALQHPNKCSCDTNYVNQYNECYHFACDEAFYISQIKQHTYLVEKNSVEKACPKLEEPNNPGYSQNASSPIIFVIDKSVMGNGGKQNPNLNVGLLKNALDLFGSNPSSPPQDPNSPSPTPDPNSPQNVPAQNSDIPMDPNVNVSPGPSGSGGLNSATTNAPPATAPRGGCSLTVAQMKSGSLSHALVFAFSLLPLIIRWRMNSLEK